ncbi:MAG: helix-turn-helix domain-containing protein [Intestinibacter sp.]|uniref:helix-turn-helix domain-containing protein n=1 Tax=Intestinibacter sp. TaxID=1965304 RepID=UPI003F17BFCA
MENKKAMGSNISKLIKREGYTKLSFAKKTGISILDLNKILEGEIIILENHIDKIMEVLNVGMEEVIENDCAEAKKNDLNTVYYDNVQQDYHRSDSVKEKLDLLDGILDLCEIYIKE